MTAAPAKHIELKPWNPSEWPLIYLWSEQYWDMVATDFDPKDDYLFTELKRLQANPPGTITLGVYAQGKLGGLLMSSPISPMVAQVHCWFRKGKSAHDSFWGREITVPALLGGINFAWRAGYEKLVCTVFPANRLMKALLNALGAVYEGKQRRHTKQHGEYVDIELWAIFRGNSEVGTMNDE